MATPGKRREHVRRRWPRLSVIIVTWRCGDTMEETLSALESELRQHDELLVIDNGSGDGTADQVGEHSRKARIIRNPSNIGFAAAVNQGAAMATGELLVTLNPDATVQPGWRKGIDRPWTESRGWGAWQPLITSDRGTTVNSEGNRIHFTGICWAGGAGKPIEDAAETPHEVGYASGACMVVPLELWNEVGGFAERLFMYGEDTDICLRLRLLGHGIGIVPEARVEHAYEFDKGPYKWRLLERGRWAFLIRCYPARLLVLIAPALIATELAVLAAAVRGGWFAEKRRSIADVGDWLPELRRERRGLQAERRIPDTEFASYLTAELDSQYLGPRVRSRPVQGLIRAYWAVARRLI